MKTMKMIWPCFKIIKGTCIRFAMSGLLQQSFFLYCCFQKSRNSAIPSCAEISQLLFKSKDRCVSPRNYSKSKGEVNNKCVGEQKSLSSDQDRAVGCTWRLLLKKADIIYPGRTLFKQVFSLGLVLATGQFHQCQGCISSCIMQAKQSSKVKRFNVHSKPA